jgi:NitT/TauT family transport system substrate-binding protein
MPQSRRSFMGSLLALPLASLSGRGLAEPDAPRPIRLNIPGPGAMPFTPIELVRKLGIDRALGVELLIRYFPSGVQGIEDMLAGNADFAGLGFVVLPRMQAKGQDVVAIAPLSGSTLPFSVVARVPLRGKVRSLADLKGRSVGVPIGSVKSKTYMQSMAELLLADGGVQADQVRWVGTGHNVEGLFGALAGEVVDAVFCEEPFTSTLVRRGAGFVLADLRNARLASSVPGAGHLRAVVATRGAFVTQDPQRVALMVQILQRALAWMHQQTPEAIIGRLDISDAQDRNDRIAALKKSPRMFPPDTRFSRAQIEATRAFLRASGDTAAESFDPARVVVDTWAGSRL